VVRVHFAQPIPTHEFRKLHSDTVPWECSLCRCVWFIERFYMGPYNPVRRRSTLGDLNHIEFEQRIRMQAHVAYPCVH